MRCKNCGKKINSDSSFCTYCGGKIEVENDETKNNTSSKMLQLKLTSLMPYKKKIITISLIVGFIIYFFCISCKVGLCLFPQSFKGEYCFIHTCERDKCFNKKAKGESYCYTHCPSYSVSSGKTYTPELAKTVLNFSNISITHNSSYTVCTGTITNNGTKTYSFVEVKGKFQDSYGTVIDTDWTYAVGSEGLAPNESKTFRLSVDKNYSIDKCEMEIIDYN